MMARPERFTVVWAPRAESQLAMLWVDGDDREAIAATVDEFDRALSRNPSVVGESREDGYRIEVCGPLAFIFNVSEPDRKVTVLRVWRPFRGR
jgi:plasmid stabilization system protein ParE